MGKNKTRVMVLPRNGFIYPFFNKFFKLFNKYLNLVEYFKNFARFLSRQRKDKDLEIAYCRIAVDFYILLKWLLVIVFWFTKSTGSFQIILVWYFLLTNLFSYFYNHVWDSNLFLDKHFDVDRVKRRFLNMLIAIFFSIIGFAYLYAVPYYFYFSWTENKNIYINSFFYSLSNSLTMNYELVKPISEIGYYVPIIQISMMAVFLSILLASSIPQFNIIKKGDRNGLQK